jgi:hypothetical protein
VPYGGPPLGLQECRNLGRRAEHRRTVQTSHLSQAALAALAKLLLPVARILLRYGVTYDGFQSVAKRAFVRAASDEFRIPGKRATASRVAILTGMNRKDVGRFMKEVEDEGEIGREPANRSARIIAGWRRDKEFQTDGGRPATLEFKADEGSFRQLVQRYGNDVPPRAALDELLRVGAVESLKDGRLRLVARAYLPSVTDEDTLAVLGSHVPDLIRSIEHNLLAEGEDSFLQRRVVYDNVPEDVIGRVSEHVSATGQSVLEELDEYLAGEDRDANPEVKGEGRRRVVLGIYFLEEEFPEDSPDD